MQPPVAEGDETVGRESRGRLGVGAAHGHGTGVDDLAQETAATLAQTALEGSLPTRPGLLARITGSGASLADRAELAPRSRAADPLAELHQGLSGPPRVT